MAEKDMSHERAAAARGYRLAVAGMEILTGSCCGLAEYQQALYEGRSRFTAFPEAEKNGKRPAEIRLRTVVQRALVDAGLERGGPVGIVILSEEATAAGGMPLKRARPLAALTGCSGPVEDIETDAAAALERAAAMLNDPRLSHVILGWISNEKQAAAALVFQRYLEGNDDQCVTIDLLDTPEIDHTVGLLVVAGEIDPSAAGTLFETQEMSESPTCAIGGEPGLPLVPAIIDSVMCLNHRFLPQSPAIEGLYGEALAGTHFYLVDASRTWFQPAARGARHAVVLDCSTCLFLSEGSSSAVRANLLLQNSTLRLYPVAGGSLEELLAGLRSIQAALLAGVDPRQVALNAFGDYQAQSGAAFAAAILGSGSEETLREIEYALKGLPKSFEKGVDWQTPLGSTFSPAPVGRDGSIAFVYPGAFNSYPGMGRDLFHIFPHLHERFSAISTDIGSVVCEELLYPRLQQKVTPEDNACLEMLLTNDPIAMLKSGTTLSTLYTMILRDVFDIEPAAAFGYSLGENSMMFAMGVWTNGDEASQRLSNSEMFRTRLSGPQNAVREHWGLSNHDNKEPLWRNYLVMTSPEQVRAAIRSEPRVYLTHINTPRQVVIGGDPDACRRVIASLRCSHLQAPFNHALHNPAMETELRGLAALHDSPIVHIPQADLYTAAGYKPLRIERQEVAERIAQMLCSSLDFPRLVEQVYAGGARVFIELGAGSNCARWVDECLQGKPHLSIGINRRGLGDLASIMRVLAKLCTHRASLNLAPLYLGFYPDGFPVQMKIPSSHECEVC
jgi:PfaB family protein